MQKQEEWVGAVARAAAYIGMAALLIGLAFFAFNGTFSRFWADDYCYSAWVKQFGLVGGLIDWYHTSGNRLSTLVVVAFSDLFGGGAIRFTALVVLAILAGAWLFFLRALRGLLGWKIAGYWLVLLALLEVYFAVLLAPDRPQTVYWRMGTYHYTLPAAVLLLNLGMAVRWLRGPGRRGALMALASGVLAFFAAGLSETFAALEAGLFLLCLLAALLLLRGLNRSRAAGLAAAAVAGTLAMMLIMMSAPANSWRQAVMPPPGSLLLIVPYSLRYSADFLFYAIRGQVVPFAIYLGAAAAVGFQAAPSEIVQRLPVRGLLIGLVGALVVMYGLVVCSFAPSAYAGLSYPAGRAQMPGSMVMLAGLGLAAILAARTMRRLLPSTALQVVEVLAALLLLACCLYPFRAAAVAWHEQAVLSTRSVRWDARNAQIRADLAAGITAVQVKQTDVVQGLEDMGPDAHNWVNACAALYYGASTITAAP